MFFFLDLETTGLDPETHEIIEIACVHTCLDLVPIGKPFHVYVMPECDPSPEVAAINGFDRKLWAAHYAVPIVVALEAFTRWVEKHRDPIAFQHWAGSNVTGFDLPFLRDFGNFKPPAGMFSHRALNVESLGMVLWLRGETEGCGLRHLRKWVGLDGEQAHTALADVNDTIRVTRALFREFGVAA